ncbi:MAG: hypothetical protein ACI80V_001383 [Rhodothermales bacterium]
MFVISHDVPDLVDSKTPTLMRLLAVFLLLFAGCRDFVVDVGEDAVGKGFRSFDVEPDVPFDIRVGDEAFLLGADLTMTFSLLVEDTRCSTTLDMCDSPGRAGILIDIARGTGDESQIILQIPGLVPVPYRLNDYVQHRDERFQLLQLAPHPRPDGTSEDPYTATLVVER